MEEPGGELAWEARSSGLREPVRTCELQPCGGLLVRQAAGVDPSSLRTASGGSVASRGSDAWPRIAAGTAGPGARQPRCPLLRLVVVAAVVFTA